MFKGAARDDGQLFLWLFIDEKEESLLQAFGLRVD